MDASLWIAKTGLDAQQTRMSVIANNLANVNTIGFKRDRAVWLRCWAATSWRRTRRSDGTP